MLLPALNPFPAGTPFISEGRDSVVEDISKKVEESELGDDADVNVEDKGVVVSFKASTFFEEESTDLNAKGVEELTRFSKLIFLLPNRIQIEGHTNDSEPKNWSSNWELSGARAAKVARFFVDNGMDPTKIIAKGFGSTRPKFSNDSPTKRKLNNRVEVIVLGE